MYGSAYSVKRIGGKELRRSYGAFPPRQVGGLSRTPYSVHRKKKAENRADSECRNLKSTCIVPARGRRRHFEESGWSNARLCFRQANIMKSSVGVKAPSFTAVPV